MRGGRDMTREFRSSGNDPGPGRSVVKKKLYPETSTGTSFTKIEKVLPFEREKEKRRD